MITKLEVRSLYKATPADTADHYDPAGIPERTAKRLEEVAAKLNEVIDAVNQLKRRLDGLPDGDGPLSSEF